MIQIGHEQLISKLKSPKGEVVFGYATYLFVDTPVGNRGICNQSPESNEIVLFELSKLLLY